MNILEKAQSFFRFWRYRRRSESESIKFLLDQDLAGTTLLDIGANKGIYTYWMSKKAGPEGRVISFEPQPELGVFLKDLRDSFNLRNVTIENKGLSDQAGEFEMIRSVAGSGGARLLEEGDNFSGRTNLHKVKVEIATLDDYFKDKQNIKLSFIKCDVENHELHVFKGGEKTLRKHMPTILFECHHEDAIKGEAFSFLTGLGYKGCFITGNKKIDYKEFDQYPYRKPTDNHRNYIFEKK